MKPSGRIAGDMKWHVYRYPQKPGTLMVLGSILTQPDDLESSLNYPSGIEPLQPDQKMDQTHAVQRTMRSELSKNAGGRLKAMLPVNPFVSAGGGLEADWSRRLEAMVEALDIRAEIIMPHTAKEYIDRALGSPQVVRYVREGLFAQPLYLVVGVATCKGLIMGDNDSRGRNFSVEADAGIPLAGVEAGAGVSRGNEASAGSESEVGEECDFAYRVKEFQYSRRKRAVKNGKDWVGGAMFGIGKEGSRYPLTSAETEALFDDVPEFDGFEDDDEDLGEDDAALTDTGDNEYH